MRQLSLRARLVLGVLLLGMIGLVAADVATYTSLRSFLFDRTDAALESAHRGVEFALARSTPGGADQQLLNSVPGDCIYLRPVGSGKTTGGCLPQFPQAQAPAGPKLPATIALPSGQGDDGDRVTYFTASARSGGGRYRVRAAVEPQLPNDVLILAAPLHDVDSTLHRLFLIESLVTVAVLAALAALGLWVVRLGLRPLAEIERTADAIAAGDLSRRVRRAEPRTEVGRLGLAFNAMLDRIEASDRRLRRFIADASHELRTPLAAVRAYAELFDRGAHRRPDDLARAMRGISRESERMTTLVEDLLLLARLDEGRALARDPVRLDEVAAEAVETSRAVDAAHPIDLEVEPATVLGDRDALRQVVDNLLGNIRSHTPPETQAHVHVSANGRNATIEIADEGPGMTPEQAERVFERFYRADPSRSRDSGGAGLGLAIVSAVTEAHGGALSLDTAPARGASFRITLPAMGDSAEAHR